MNERRIAWAVLLTLAFWGVVAFVIYVKAYGCMPIDGDCPTDSEVRSAFVRILLVAAAIYAGGVFAFRRLFSK
ncbi:MAG: hypothetical protein ACT4N8_10040 [Sphingosinicella sp.]|uniref:hypothetical protein n=1 Tax=Sphingosinicella sp. TaxID=1917971 RepID=UPI004037FB15